jgi:hypothetical protein
VAGAARDADGNGLHGFRNLDFDAAASHVAPDGTVTLRYKRFSWWLGSRGVVAHLTLTSSVPWTIELRGGISELQADLRDLQIEAIDINGGASSSELWLPRPRGTSQVRVTGGASHIVVRRPKGTAAQAIVRGGANSLAFDAQHQGSFGSTTRFATPDFESATDRWAIEVTGGANNLSVTEE